MGRAATTDSSFRYRMTRRSYTKIVTVPTSQVQTLRGHVIGHSTKGIQLINGRTVRLAWNTKGCPKANFSTFHKSFHNSDGGVYVVRLTFNDGQNVLPGLLCLRGEKEELPSCGCAEIMVFAPWTLKENNKHIPMLRDVHETFPLQMCVQVEFVVKVNNFSSLAHDAWLHDHIQFTLRNVHKWSASKGDERKKSSSTCKL